MPLAPCQCCELLYKVLQFKKKNDESYLCVANYQHLYHVKDPTPFTSNDVPHISFKAIACVPLVNSVSLKFQSFLFVPTSAGL
ncbi:hypothetical protein QVD17_26550 [Tagetes erecta]|uniref:Uncharacterized protein n=1 Tax=Tagetes erecta TaxID=13708 RepID=A0AAD8NQW2_TARER|nr:hypothetical protein QVD17_26550 [Tagetes erecta]